MAERLGTSVEFHIIDTNDIGPHGKGSAERVASILTGLSVELNRQGREMVWPPIPVERTETQFVVPSVPLPPVVPSGAMATPEAP